jgi:hypothetical protein
MKKIFFSILVICAFFVSNSYAQLEKGRMYLGANVGFTSGTSKNTSGNNTASGSTSSFSLLPNFGYFVAPNMSVGLGIGFAQEKSKPSNTQTNTTNTFVIAPHFRYWVPTSSEQFVFFVQAQLGVGSGTRKSETTGTGSVTTEFDISNFEFFVSPNFAYFPTKSWGIEFGFRGIGYETATTKQKNTSIETKTTISNFVLDVNSFAPILAVRYFF